MISNLVVDAIVRHWISLMEDGKAENEEKGREIQWRGTFFYLDDGLI